MATIGDAAGELREDIPLKSGTKSSSLCSCYEDLFGGSRFISIAFAVLTCIITVALLVQIYYGDFQVVPHGSVASDSRECSEIGTSILKEGGNAIDAAIGAAFCLAVVNPHTTGLDAHGQILIYNHRTRLNAEVLDFSKYQTSPDQFPKLVTSLAYIHKLYGKTSWKNIIEPAADLARKGFFVSKQLELAIKKSNAENLYGPLQAGEKIKLESLSNTLNIIAETNPEDFFQNISAIYRPIKTEALKSNFREYNIFVPNSPSIGPELLVNLQHIEQINLTNSDIAKPDYVYKLANITQMTLKEFNVSTVFHQGSSSNIAVMDLNDLYVSLIIGMYEPFGARQMTSGGYLFDVKGNSVPCGRIPFIITDSEFTCGKRMVLGASDITTASQVITALLVGAENATSSIESPRFNFIDDSSIGLEDDHIPLFSDEVLQELEKLGTLFHVKEPYNSCNIVEKIADNLNSHSDSRGGGISSRF